MATIKKIKPAKRQAGFTLIEMLVVLVFVILLASLVVAFAPRLTERQKVASGASQLQEWLLIAKSRAKRDQQPTGVRLLLDPNNSTQIRELQYIQQPDDFFVQLGSSQVRKLEIRGSNPQFPDQPPYNLAVLQLAAPGAADFRGGLGNDQTVWPVQVGDYLEIKGGGLVHYITQVQADRLVLSGGGTPNRVWPTEDYRIIRKPRVLTGETSLLLPKDIAIDISPRPAVWNPPTDPREPREPRLSQGVPSTLDGTVNIYTILFSPAGGVIGQGTSRDRIILYVRDVSLDNPQDGEPVLISIEVRTGFISAHPINPDNNFSNIYSFTRDGRGSGI